MQTCLRESSISAWRGRSARGWTRCRAVWTQQNELGSACADSGLGYIDFALSEAGWFEMVCAPSTYPTMLSRS